MCGKLKVREYRVLERPLVQNADGRLSLQAEWKPEIEVDIAIETDDCFNYLTGKVRINAPSGEETTLAEIRQSAVEKARLIIE